MLTLRKQPPKMRYCIRNATNGPKGSKTRKTLNPGFGAQRQVHGNSVSAIHQPDTSNELEQPYNAITSVPGEQASRNFRGIDEG